MFNVRQHPLAPVFRGSLAALFLAAVSLAPSYAAPAPAARLKAAPSASAPAAVVERASSGYLSQAELQINDFPAPPAPGSAMDQDDLATVLQWQKDRTDLQCSEAMKQSDESFISMFRSVNPFPTPLPAEVSAFFKRVDNQAGDANRYIKKIYKRDRPFVRSSAVNPCLGRVQGFSYPSGHATVSRIYGLILSDLLPRQGAIFMRSADQAALYRVIGGVHNPSDIEAGKRLGDILYQKLKANKAFMADMEAVSRQLR